METIYNHFSSPFRRGQKSSTNFSYVHFIQSRWFSFFLLFSFPRGSSTRLRLYLDPLHSRPSMPLPLFLRSLKNESLRDFQANWFSIILIAKLVWLWRTEEVKLFHFLGGPAEAKLSYVNGKSHFVCLLMLMRQKQGNEVPYNLLL